jgi:hypothetical protein
MVTVVDIICWFDILLHRRYFWNVENYGLSRHKTFLLFSHPVAISVRCSINVIHFNYIEINIIQTFDPGSNSWPYITYIPKMRRIKWFSSYSMGSCTILIPNIPYELNALYSRRPCGVHFLGFSPLNVLYKRFG